MNDEFVWFLVMMLLVGLIIIAIISAGGDHEDFVYYHKEQMICRTFDPADGDAKTTCYNLAPVKK